MLRKKTNGVARRPQRTSLLSNISQTSVDRRTFIRGSGLAIGGLAAIGATGGMVTGAKAQKAVRGAVKTVKSVCTHCSVGCTVLAEVNNGVWVGQEPGWDSPFNLGAHCAKGAAVREHANGERRLKYPMKKAGGKWQRISWDQAINEIGDGMMKIRKESGPDSVYWLGSAKFSNEQAYLFRKFAAYWGSNNVDHQARICHSTTVAGVANTWGYGAMTNSYNDIPQQPRHLPYRRQPRGGAPGLAPARASGEGAEQRAADRLRPPVHQDRGARRRVCAVPSGLGRRAHLGHHLAHLRERVGGQGVHPHPRLGGWTRSARR